MLTKDFQHCEKIQLDINFIGWFTVMQSALNPSKSYKIIFIESYM